MHPSVHWPLFTIASLEKAMNMYHKCSQLYFQTSIAILAFLFTVNRDQKTILKAIGNNRKKSTDILKTGKLMQSPDRQPQREILRKSWGRNSLFYNGEKQCSENSLKWHFSPCLLVPNTLKNVMTLLTATFETKISEVVIIVFES